MLVCQVFWTLIPTFAGGDSGLRASGRQGVPEGPYTRFPSSTLLPFFWGVPLLKPNSRKKGTLIIKGLLGNLVYTRGPNSIMVVYMGLKGV